MIKWLNGNNYKNRKIKLIIMVDNNLAQNANTKSNVNNMVSLHVWVKINISHNKWKIFTSQDYFYWCKQWKSFKKIVVKEKSLLEILFLVGKSTLNQSENYFKYSMESIKETHNEGIVALIFLILLRSILLSMLFHCMNYLICLFFNNFLESMLKCEKITHW